MIIDKLQRHYFTNFCLSEFNSDLKAHFSYLSVKKREKTDILIS